MHQNWIQRSESTLKRIKQLMERPKPDRLELVQIMRFALGALGMSLSGWMQWISSPEIMSSFTRDELEKMAKTITGMVEKFITYDIEMTNKGVKKGLGKRRAAKPPEIRFVI